MARTKKGTTAATKSWKQALMSEAELKADREEKQYYEGRTLRCRISSIISDIRYDGITEKTAVSNRFTPKEWKALKKQYPDIQKDIDEAKESYFQTVENNKKWEEQKAVDKYEVMKKNEREEAIIGKAIAWSLAFSVVIAFAVYVAISTIK